MLPPSDLSPFHFQRTCDVKEELLGRKGSVCAYWITKGIEGGGTWRGERQVVRWDGTRKGKSTCFFSDGETIFLPVNTR